MERHVLAPQATAPVWPEPTLIAQRGAGAAAQAAHPPAGHGAGGSAAATWTASVMRIAELSPRIDAAIYELLCYLREFDRQHGWEGCCAGCAPDGAARECA